MDKRYKKRKNKYNNDTTPIPLQINTNNNYYQSEYNSQELPLINSRYYTQNRGYLSKSTELELVFNKPAQFSASLIIGSVFKFS